jgi:hypothetical protein
VGINSFKTRIFSLIRLHIAQGNMKKGFLSRNLRIYCRQIKKKNLSRRPKLAFNRPQLLRYAADFSAIWPHRSQACGHNWNVKTGGVRSPLSRPLPHIFCLDTLVYSTLQLDTAPYLTVRVCVPYKKGYAAA